MLLVAFGLVSAGGLVGLAPARATCLSAGLPLRSRRRIGQLLLTTVEVSRRKALVFLTIGLAILLLGLLTPQITSANDWSLPFNLYGPLDSEVASIVRAVLQVELQIRARLPPPALGIHRGGFAPRSSSAGGRG